MFSFLPKKKEKKEIHVCVDMAGMTPITCTAGVEDVCISVVTAVILIFKTFFFFMSAFLIP